MGYRREDDILIEHIGSVILPSGNRIIVDIRQYGELQPAVAIIHEDNRRGQFPYLSKEIPRLKEPESSLELSELLAIASEKHANLLDEDDDYDEDEEEDYDENGTD